MKRDPNGVYTVVAGGPSIENLQLVSWRLGTVVCINRAFYRFPGLCDVWAAMDNPKSMFTSMPEWGGHREDNRAANRQLLDKHRPEVWTDLGHEAAWRDFIGSMGEDGESISLVPIDFGQWKGNVKAPLPVVSWETEADWLEGTTMKALGKLVAGGAKYIRLLGCDQSGIGGYGYEATEEAGRRKKPGVYRKGWWAERWERERSALEVATRECAARGITLERIVDYAPAQVEGVPT